MTPHTIKGPERDRPTGAGASRARRPASPPAPEAAADEPLEERKAAILKAVVAEYIESAQPVGSGHITGTPGVEVSSATVRSEMAALERDGYLMQPHTSAGRIPTDKGYRFFVDHLGGPGTLRPDQRQQVRHFFRHVHGEVEELLDRTSGFLADLTDYAAVVVGPSHDQATIRSVQLVDLGSQVALLVVVLSDGAVEKRSFDLGQAVDEATLTGLGGRLTHELRGRSLGEAGQVALTGDGSDDALVRRATAAMVTLSVPDEADHVFVGGSSRMAAAFDAVETVRSVLSILEQQLVVVELIEQILDRGLSVAIGTEHGFEPLASCALVVAPVSVDGDVAGTIGVLGPTRMNYPKALTAVRVVGEQLSERLGRAGSASQTQPGEGD
ncbi:MAG TPA: heat-inducible transcriptional repressor HrcA [Acidimicrobiales bacterium]|nr:heat-inducible transcriptional repressor HrcA [Acidimicrobiales bacterium]